MYRHARPVLDHNSCIYPRRVLARRLLILAAVLMLLTALAAGIAPRERADTGTPPGAAAPAPLPSGTTKQRTIAAVPGADARVRVRRGDELQLQVKGNVLDTVLLERLDRLDGIDPDSPAHFDLLIDAPKGVYPIKLVESGRRIGLLAITW
jgi:hypothetical protein